VTQETAASNADQIAYWNGEAGARWVARQQRLDAMLEPLTQTALDAAAPALGERVIDIGCGCGATVLELARRVGPQGRVLGVDVSAPMLEVAGRRIAEAGLSQASVVLDDAATRDLGGEQVTLAFSRFGVMFFRDPAAAFANLRLGLRAEGRLAFLCWRTPAENPMFQVPLEVAKPYLPPSPPPAPDEPGPFAFRNPDRVRGILATAGWRQVAIDPVDTAMPVAGPGEIDMATEAILQSGPVARAFAELTSEHRDAVRTALRERLGAYDGPGGVVLPGAVWLVQARA
jgi:SAM-dependent methyltransferase